MEQLYHQTNKQLQELQSELANLERKSDSDEFRTGEAQINSKVDNVLTSCERLDMLVMKEPPARRANAKMRVNQLKYDCQHVQSFLRQLQHKRYVREQEENEREALLSRTFTTNAEQDHSVMMDPALSHHSKLHESHRAVDDLLAHGGSIITGLRDQRGVLKNAHRRILDISNTLGLTNTVMRLVEKRSSQDRVILVVLIVVSLVLMYAVWKYFS